MSVDMAERAVSGDDGSGSDAFWRHAEGQMEAGGGNGGQGFVMQEVGLRPVMYRGLLGAAGIQGVTRPERVMPRRPTLNELRQLGHTGLPDVGPQGTQF